MEVERQVEAGQIRAIVGHQSVDGEVGLPDHDPIRMAVGDPSHRLDRGVDAWLIDRSGLQPAGVRRHTRPPIRVGRVVAVLLIFVEMVDRVHPESVDAAVEPESQHVAHGFLDLRIAPIEVRLLLQVRVIVVLAGRLVESPSRAAELALPVVWRGAVRLRVSPDIPVPLWMELRGATILEPGMLIGGVVRHEIQDDLEAARVSGLKERVEIGERAEQRMDGAVIADVVTKVPHRRGKDGRDPDRVDPQPRQMVKSSRNPVEIADAVAVRVLERPRIDLVDHSRPPPSRLFHGVPPAYAPRTGSNRLGPAESGLVRMT